jgi:hypothetical protein
VYRLNTEVISRVKLLYFDTETHCQRAWPGPLTVNSEV